MNRGGAHHLQPVGLLTHKVNLEGGHLLLFFPRLQTYGVDDSTPVQLLTGGRLVSFCEKICTIRLLKTVRIFDLLPLDLLRLSFVLLRNTLFREHSKTEVDIGNSTDTGVVISLKLECGHIYHLVTGVRTTF